MPFAVDLVIRERFSCRVDILLTRALRHFFSSPITRSASSPRFFQYIKRLLVGFINDLAALFLRPLHQLCVRSVHDRLSGAAAESSLPACSFFCGDFSLPLGPRRSTVQTSPSPQTCACLARSIIGVAQAQASFDISNAFDTPGIPMISLICRAQRSDVKLHARILVFFTCHRKRFDLAVVRRRQHIRCALASESSSSIAIASAAPSAGSVPAPSSSSSTKRITIGIALYDTRDVGHMRRKRAETLLNALLVADVGIDARHTPAALCRCRRVRTAQHCAISTSNPDKLERHRFSAGIRPCDDQSAGNPSSIRSDTGTTILG